MVVVVFVVVVVVMVGMDLDTYFLSFSRLARRSIVFWGHAVTSGVSGYQHTEVDDNDGTGTGGSGGTSGGNLYGERVDLTGELDWERGGPDYFVSSVLFESKSRHKRENTRESSAATSPAASLPSFHSSQHHRHNHHDRRSTQLAQFQYQER